MTPVRRRVWISSGLILLILIGGVTGYVLIEGWTIGESLYMTVITATTVGFGEVHELSDTGRSFTIIFLLVSVATVGFSISTVLSYLFEGQIVAGVKERRMQRAIARIRDHYIVCGAGDIGRAVVQEFRQAGTPFVVIERDLENSELAGDDETLVVRGDASEESVLREARIDDAAGLIAVLPNDVENVFVTLSARQINPALVIIAKGSDAGAMSKLERAGADRVITPSKIAGRRIASSILRPSVVEFLDVIVDDSQMSMRMEEFAVTDESPLAQSTLRDARIGEHTGAIVLAIADARGHARTDATRSGLSSVTIHAGDRVIALGSEEQLEQLGAFCTMSGEAERGTFWHRRRRDHGA